MTARTPIVTLFTDEGFQKLHLLRGNLYARTLTECLRRALKESPLKSAKDRELSIAEANAWATIHEVMASYSSKTEFATAIGMTLPGLSKAMVRQALTPALVDGLRKGAKVKLDLPEPRKAIHRIVCPMSPAELAMLDKRAKIAGTSRSAALESAVIAAAATQPRGGAPQVEIEAVKRLQAFRSLAKKYKTQLDLAEAMGIYPERVSRILAGNSPIGDVLAKRMAALLPAKKKNG